MHARCWSEEVELLLEEMRRVCKFLEWQARFWDQQAYRKVESDHTQLKGLAAYAKKQASIRREMRVRFTDQWRYAEEYAQLGMDTELPDTIN